ncbi:MAG: B12-binding domain-containing radical SAM protein, partial [Nitrospirota bacterium]
TILGSVIRNEGFDVQVLDVDAIEKGININFSDEYRQLELYREGLSNIEHKAWRDVVDVLNEFRPDVIGITAMTMKFGSAVRLAEICKKWDKESVVVIGGPHPSAMPDHIFRSPFVDFAIRGEGEVSLVKFLKMLNNGGDKFSGIMGLSYKNDNEIIHNQLPEPIKDLNTLPFPGRDILMYQKNYTSEDMGVIMTSRGCPFKCSYCFHMWGKGVRYRSVENVIEEIKWVKERYRTVQFTFKDDSFTINRKFVISLCDSLIKEGLKINWECTTRADLIDDPLIEKMMEAGCNIIKIGVESGSARILKEMDKGEDLEDIKRAADILNRHGMFWSAYFMMGLPAETEDDIIATYRFMKELNPYYAGIGVYAANPNTKLFNEGVRLGLIDEKIDIDHFFKKNAKDYFFKDPSKRMLNLGPEEFTKITSFMMKEFHRHNTGIRNIIRRGLARRKTYLKDPPLLVKDCRKALRWVFHN